MTFSPSNQTAMRNITEKKIIIMKESRLIEEKENLFTVSLFLMIALKVVV